MRRTARKKPEVKGKPQPYQLHYLMKPVDKIAIDCDSHLYTSLRLFPDVKEHIGKDGKWFTVPANRSNILAVEALATPDTVTKEYKEFRNQIMSFSTPWSEGAIQYCAVNREIFNHQKQFVELAHDKKGFINGSEQGTGKTTPAFILMHSLGAQRIIVVCPKSGAGEWIRESKKLWDKGYFEFIQLSTGSIPERKKLMEEILSAPLKPKHAQIILINYEALYELMNHLILWQPQMMFLDESWRIKNPSAKCTVAAMLLSEHCSQVFPMSGTCIGNDVGDLWTQLQIANNDLLGGMSYSDFMQRFATFKPINTAGGARMMPVGVSDAAGLMRLIEPVWYRATKSTCLNLPPKQYEIVNIPLSPESRKLYDDVKSNGLAALGEEMSLEGDRVIRLRLHQIAGGFKPVPTEEFNNKGNRLWDVEDMPCSKLEWLIQWHKDNIPTDSEIRSIIWVRFNAEGGRIKEALSSIYDEENVKFIYAGTPDDKLEEWKDNFNSRNPDGIKVLVCQIQKMCSVHNLPAGDCHFFFSNWYSYINRSQAEERSHRADRQSQEGIRIYDLISKDTIDEEIYQTLSRKESLSARLTPATAALTIGEDEEE